MFYLASIYIFRVNYICMHMLRHYGSLKCVKNAYVYFRIYAF